MRTQRASVSWEIQIHVACVIVFAALTASAGDGAPPNAAKCDEECSSAVAKAEELKQAFGRLRRQAYPQMRRLQRFADASFEPEPAAREAAPAESLVERGEAVRSEAVPKAPDVRIAERALARLELREEHLQEQMNVLEDRLTDTPGDEMHPLHDALETGTVGQDQNDMYGARFGKAVANMKELIGASQARARDSINDLHSWLQQYNGLNVDVNSAFSSASSLLQRVDQAREAQALGLRKDVAYTQRAEAMCGAEWTYCTRLSPSEVSPKHAVRLDFSPLSPKDNMTNPDVMRKVFDGCTCRKDACEAGVAAVVDGDSAESSEVLECLQIEGIKNSKRLQSFVMRQPWPFDYFRHRDDPRVQELALAVSNMEAAARESPSTSFSPRLTDILRNNENLPGWQSDEAREAFFS